MSDNAFAAETAWAQHPSAHALRECVARLRDVQRVARLGFWRWSTLRQRFEVWSEGLQEICGLEANWHPVSRDDFYELVHSGDRAFVMAEHERAIREEQGIRLEYSLRRPGGEIRQVVELTEAERDQDGSIIAFSGTIQDVTNWKRTELALSQSETRVRNLIAGSVQGILVERDLKPVFANTAFAHIFGYARPEEVLELDSVADLLMLEERRALKKRHFAFLRGELPPERLELRGMRKDGAPIWIEGATRLIDWDGTQAILTTVVDVTERKRAEAALRQSEARFRHLFDESPLSIWEADWSGIKRMVDSLLARGIVDLESHLRANPDIVKEAIASIRVIDFNNASVAVYRAASREELERHMQEFLDGTYWDEMPSVIAALSAGVSRHTLQSREKALDGSELTVRIIRRVPEGFEDSWSRIIEIVEDTTEAKRAEEALRRSEALFRSVVDNSPSVIAVKDLEGRFVLANRRFEEVFGMSVETLLGATSFDIFPQEEASLYAQLDEQVLKSGENLTEELQVTLPDGGSSTYYTTRFPLLDSNGRPVGIGSISTDLTELRHTEALLRQAQKMETIGQLTGGVAHDFNNLLAIVIGNLELIEDAATDEEIQPLLDPAMRAARRGAELTSRLLAFARRQPLEPEVVELGGMIGGLTSVLRSVLGATIEVRTRIADDLWPTLVDPAQMENALINLAVNARDAMPGGGTLTIEASNAELGPHDPTRSDELDPGPYVKLVVSDNGKGMASTEAEQAFDPFFTTKEVGKGSGLGLSMVYGFSKQSGGDSAIASEPGRGTSVTLYLPKANQKAGAPAAPQQEADPAPAASEVVLVVEDDADVRLLTLQQIRRLGYHVVEAADGIAALAALQQNPVIDLLLTDVVLPGGMTGLDVAREARRLKPGIRVLFMSGYSKDAMVEAGEMDGSVELLSKPFTRADLASRVRRSLELPNRPPVQAASQP